MAQFVVAQKVANALILNQQLGHVAATVRRTRQPWAARRAQCRGTKPRLRRDPQQTSPANHCPAGPRVRTRIASACARRTRFRTLAGTAARSSRRKAVDREMAAGEAAITGHLACGI